VPSKRHGRGRSQSSCQCILVSSIVRLYAGNERRESTPYTVIMTLAFLYQLSKGLSPFFVVVSAMSALPAMKSSCRYVRAKRPVIDVYMGSMTSKSVGKRISK
jgi:hypothetical protein